jgi:hypothetical protein
MRWICLIIASVLFACNDKTATAVDVRINDNLVVVDSEYIRFAQYWFDSETARRPEIWRDGNYRIVEPDPARYDSLALATGLPKNLFVYLDALHRVYKPTLYQTGDGKQEILLDIDPTGVTKKFAGVSCENLNYFNARIESDIKYILKDPAYDSVTLRYKIRSKDRLIKCKEVTFGLEVLPQFDGIDEEMEEFLSLHGFVSKIESKDSTKYVKISQFESEGLLNDEEKYRLAGLSPIMITSMMKESAREFKNIVYITSRVASSHGKMLPPKIDTALIVPVERWRL